MANSARAHTHIRGELKFAFIVIPSKANNWIRYFRLGSTARPCHVTRAKLPPHVEFFRSASVVFGKAGLALPNYFRTPTKNVKTEISLVGGPDHLLHETNSLSMGELLGQNKVRKVI